MPMTAREIEKLLKNDGWEQVAQKGSHRQYKNSNKPGKVTIPWHKNGNAPIHPTTEKSILRQAGH